MAKQPWHAIDWHKLGPNIGDPVALIIVSGVYVLLFPKPDIACVLEQSGEIVAAWGDDCRK